MPKFPYNSYQNGELKTCEVRAVPPTYCIKTLKFVSPYHDFIQSIIEHLEIYFWENSHNYNTIIIHSL